MEWTEGVWDSEKKEYKLLANKMAIKQESVKLSISDDCNGHDGDVEIKINDNDEDYDDNDYHDNDDDDDDDKV